MSFCFGVSLFCFRRLATGTHCNLVFHLQYILAFYSCLSRFVLGNMASNSATMVNHLLMLAENLGYLYHYGVVADVVVGFVF